MHFNNMDFVSAYIKKLYRLFLLVVCIIAAIELALTLRGLLIFDLSRLKHRLYFYSYLFLLIVSLITPAVSFLCKNRENRDRIMVLQVYLYSFCLILWSAFVTAIDCIANGDSGVIVFIMVCISVGVLTLIRPLFYTVILCVSGGALLILVWLLRGEPYSGGFYINFTVFIILAIFINAHTYRLNQKEYESASKLSRLSYTDQLTGIYNRRHLDMQIAKYAERGEHYLFMLIDVDNFKAVNDTHGHAAGDECLVLIAQKLGECFGERIYRFGGDEFAVICDVSDEAACQGIDRINQELIRTYEGIDLHISAGAYRPKPGDSSNLVFIRTDRALYKAKADGKNICRIFEGEKS